MVMMASGKLIVLVSMAAVLVTSSITLPEAVLLGVQDSGTNLKGPSALLSRALYDQEPAIDPLVTAETCGPPFGWSGAFFGCGFLCGIIITVLVVGAISDRNLTSAKPAGAVGEKTSQLAANDPGPETGATDAESLLLFGDSWLQRPVPKDSQEIFDNIQEFWPRCTCLAVLLFVQSGSSIILESFEHLVREHTSLVYFFTMLMGLGGNAGVQSVVLAVRRFATGEEVSVSEQFYMGVKLAAVLAPLAFLRCKLQGTTLDVCLTVGLASVVITVLATSLGTSLALLLHKFRMDPAHASPTIQVIMDMAGLLIACSMGWTIMTLMAT